MPKCQIWKDVNGEWRWRKTSKDGDIEAHSEKGFESREDCEKHGKENGGCTRYQRV